VEHVADFPGKRIARFRVPVLENGRRVWREMREINTSGAGAHPAWPDRFFALIVDGYLAETGTQGGTVGDALSHLFPARALLEYAIPMMERRAGRGPNEQSTGEPGN
jgi:aminoglycoside 3-N-acetyltransferase